MRDELGAARPAQGEGKIGFLTGGARRCTLGAVITDLQGFGATAAFERVRRNLQGVDFCRAPFVKPQKERLTAH